MPILKCILFKMLVGIYISIFFYQYKKYCKYNYSIYLFDLKKGVSMINKITKKICCKITNLAIVLILSVGVFSAEMCCVFWFYQPPLPEELKKEK